MTGDEHSNDEIWFFSKLVGTVTTAHALSFESFRTWFSAEPALSGRDTPRDPGASAIPSLGAQAIRMLVGGSRAEEPALGGPHCKLGVLKDVLHRDPFTLNWARRAARITSRS